MGRNDILAKAGAVVHDTPFPPSNQVKTMDCIATINTFNAGRDPERLNLKYQKMAENPFVFLRGTCHWFYATLAAHTLKTSAPLTWSCGDLHLENFGSYKGDNRLVYFDINDFDEAALAPCTWDLVRFLTSVHLGCREVTGDGALGDTLCGIYVRAYGSALAAGKARWVEKETANGPVRSLLEGLKGRKRVDYLDSRTILKGHHRHLNLTIGKALPVTEKQRLQVADFMENLARQSDDPTWFTVHDVARRIAGTGSLGVDRYIVLVEGKGSPDGNYLLDLKEALPSALSLSSEVIQPAWSSEAERVVNVQFRLQACSMAFLRAVQMSGKPYLLRGLQPSEDRVCLLPKTSLQDWQYLMETCGQVTAWAHLRGSGRQGAAGPDELIAFGQRTDWHSSLLQWALICAQQVRTDWKIWREYYTGIKKAGELPK